MGRHAPQWPFRSLVFSLCMLVGALSACGTPVDEATRVRELLPDRAPSAVLQQTLEMPDGTAADLWVGGTSDPANCSAVVYVRLPDGSAGPMFEQPRCDAPQGATPLARLLRVPWRYDPSKDQALSYGYDYSRSFAFGNVAKLPAVSVTVSVDGRSAEVPVKNHWFLVPLSVTGEESSVFTVVAYDATGGQLGVWTGRADGPLHVVSLCNAPGCRSVSSM